MDCKRVLIIVGTDLRGIWRPKRGFISAFPLGTARPLSWPCHGHTHTHTRTYTLAHAAPGILSPHTHQPMLTYTHAAEPSSSCHRWLKRYYYLTAVLTMSPSTHTHTHTHWHCKATEMLLSIHEIFWSDEDPVHVNSFCKQKQNVIFVIFAGVSNLVEFSLIRWLKLFSDNVARCRCRMSHLTQVSWTLPEQLILFKS